MSRRATPRSVRNALHEVRRLIEVLRENGQHVVAEGLERDSARIGNWMATRSTLVTFEVFCHPQSLGGSQYPGIGARAWEKRMTRLARCCREAVEELDRMSPEERAAFSVR